MILFYYKIGGIYEEIQKGNKKITKKNNCKYYCNSFSCKDNYTIC